VDVDVLARQPLAQKSSLAVVRLGERALVLGVTESRVELLHETALSDVLVPYQPYQPGQAGTDVPASSVPRTRRAWSSNGAARSSVLKARGATAASGEGPLAGSALSPQTWSRAVQVLREKTVRK
jgi:flagellar protein FliO/FliZ